jgi:hypothetical protein
VSGVSESDLSATRLSGSRGPSHDRHGGRRPQGRAAGCVHAAAGAAAAAPRGWQSQTARHAAHARARRTALPRPFLPPRCTSRPLPRARPPGEWVSPIGSELITSKTLGLGSPSLLPGGTVTWAELRPSEGGRNVIVAR